MVWAIYWGFGLAAQIRICFAFLRSWFAIQRSFGILEKKVIEKSNSAYQNGENCFNGVWISFSPSHRYEWEMELSRGNWIWNPTAFMTTWKTLKQDRLDDIWGREDLTWLYVLARVIMWKVSSLEMLNSKSVFATSQNTLSHFFRFFLFLEVNGDWVSVSKRGWSKYSTWNLQHKTEKTNPNTTINEVKLTK